MPVLMVKSELPSDIPKLNSDGFICPHCHHHSEQRWSQLVTPIGSYLLKDFGLAECVRCNVCTLWANKELVYPHESTAPSPHEDMPNNVKSLFEQARNVLKFSPIASCALLRLVVEKIVDELVEGSDSLNEKIGKLVKGGLNKKIQEALDSVRVIGSNAVHPLYMDLEDDEPTARQLFELVNIIVAATISLDKKIGGVYSKLPDPSKKQISERDNSK